ncbi:hypothetical protein A3I95_01550 [Candidatus Nomurabacteria bacterium RIFCSPLOWO2_02_FULL_44_12]|uniref:L-threonylcarbamoyladenylate synthase n=1 Tax=Candidatus Nomurabacteria bacterium RIFCSPLOWO2_12_FULL_44_11 TaxID=1801796 RepID=A0A1F6Y6I1_9BACT|nr:MAG: hypothetical protein A3G53_01650 [Candidatus Nomurabacteria bacterium RIFCSPLOWO2_12_FULL_44_11]OGJ08496.1 MAG: hypothetical protein A3I95_01550 [Candidatus Nomurabacteria bacterium RIFCSPLOWO2_02_FULL_44_12]
MWSDPNLLKVLKGDGVVVMPTDTLYGIVGRAQNASTVEKIYKIKKRSPEKKLINLIADWEDIKKFRIDPKKFKIPQFNEPTSVILEDISFRLPQNENLRELIRKTGPLVAPSANPEDLPPAQNIDEARKYFGNQVDLYIDGGTITARASKVIRLHADGSITILRE